MPTNDNFKEYALCNVQQLNSNDRRKTHVHVTNHFLPTVFNIRVEDDGYSSVNPINDRSTLGTHPGASQSWVISEDHTRETIFSFLISTLTYLFLSDIALDPLPTHTYQRGRNTVKASVK